MSQPKGKGLKRGSAALNLFREKGKEVLGDGAQRNVLSQVFGLSGIASLAERVSAEEEKQKLLEEEEKVRGGGGVGVTKRNKDYWKRRRTTRRTMQVFCSSLPRDS